MVQDVQKSKSNDYQVKEVAESAGISARTLHYYDEIGLLSPSRIAENGYRFYDENALVRLQQILFFKEFGFPLAEIQEMLSNPAFEPVQALNKHKNHLLREMERLENMLTTIDHTIQYLKGERIMAKEEFFNPEYDPSKQAEYEEEIQQKHGDKELKQSKQRWGSYSEAKRREVMDEGNEIIQNIFENLTKGFEHPDVQKDIARYHKYMFYFYDCSYDVFEGLGHMYYDDPRFRAKYEVKHPDFPEFMMNAMKFYADQHR